MKYKTKIYYTFFNNLKQKTANKTKKYININLSQIQ